jgi:chaperonin GroEL
VEYQKAKSAHKLVIPRGEELRSKILRTSEIIANIVGGTLGPGGHPVLIERPEFGLPPIITKDGVTVFRALGFMDATMHCIMESQRDASVRTATEAGDGTTTATILGDAFLRNTLEYTEKNPELSSQVIIRDIQKTYSDVLEPEVNRLSIRGDLESDEGRAYLKAVAVVSGNGDQDLASAVMECFDICGDEGNVTIIEATGPSGYGVEKVSGYPVAMGYEESLRRFYPAFINRPDLQQILVEKPAFVLYFGSINDIQTLVPLMKKVQEAWEGEYLKTPNIVVVAVGFSEAVLASLTTNWSSPGSINILPILVPNNSPIHNAQRNFLDDLAAVTGSTVFDPITRPLDNAEFTDIGNIALDEDDAWKPLGVREVEVSRYRTSVVGVCQDDILIARAEQVKVQAEQSESELESSLIRERLAKLTGGIARLRVIGSSNGEVKERRDRAEDAICAVRGAIKHGCLPAGCWTLIRLAVILPHTKINTAIVIPALFRPLVVLLSNVGINISPTGRTKMSLMARLFCKRPQSSDLSFSDDDLSSFPGFLESARSGVVKDAVIYDVSGGRMVNAVEAGLLDSTPAVREALKNAISIATLMGTLGGTIVQPRDHTFESKEGHAASDFERNSNFNPADERGL